MSAVHAVLVRRALEGDINEDHLALLRPHNGSSHEHPMLDDIVLTWLAFPPAKEASALVDNEDAFRHWSSGSLLEVHPHAYTHALFECLSDVNVLAVLHSPVAYDPDVLISAARSSALVSMLEKNASSSAIFRSVFSDDIRGSEFPHVLVVFNVSVNAHGRAGSSFLMALEMLLPVFVNACAHGLAIRTKKTSISFLQMAIARWMKSLSLLNYGDSPFITCSRRISRG